jgi:glycosyltransferase involved in cell wall biosynthesis
VGADGPGHRVVAQGDAGALAASMSEVLRHRDSEIDGAAALFREVSAQYSWETVTTATEQVYARVMARRAPRSTAAKSPGSELPV